MERASSFIVANDLSLLTLLRALQNTHTLYDVYQLSDRRLIVQMMPLVPGTLILHARARSHSDMIIDFLALNKKGNVMIGSTTTSKGQLYLFDGLMQASDQVWCTSRARARAHL